MAFLKGWNVVNSQGHRHRQEMWVGSASRQVETLGPFLFLHPHRRSSNGNQQFLTVLTFLWGFLTLHVKENFYSFKEYFTCTSCMKQECGYILLYIKSFKHLPCFVNCFEGVFILFCINQMFIGANKITPTQVRLWSIQDRERTLPKMNPILK